MAFKIDKPFASERRLSQSVIQVIELLGMYHAELARILGLQCSDIGELTSAQRCIQRDTESWQRAVLFIRTYHLLFDYFESLNGTPHFLIVDDGQLQRVYDYLYRANQEKNSVI